MSLNNIFSDLPFKFTPSRFIILGYLTVIFVGTTLLTLPIASQSGEYTGVVDALFTATSAVCVTGLIVVNTAEYWSTFGQTVILILIQIGGLGFMTISTLAFMVIGKRITFSERILIKEDLGHINYSGLVRLVRHVIGLTFGVEAVGAFFLFLKLRQGMETGRAVWFSVFHAISAFCNAGFDIFGNSLENFTESYSINLVMIGLIVIGGIGFTVVYELWEKKPGKSKLMKLSLHTKMVLLITFVLLVVGTIVIFIFEYNNEATMGGLSYPHRLLSSFFLSVTPRTAGFNTVPTGALEVNTLFFIVLLMFVGASPCSTGGGIKTTTFGSLLAYVGSCIRSEKDTTVFKRRLEDSLIREAVAITFLASLLVFTTSLVLSITEEADFIGMLFESVSAFGTVGLSTGITGELSRIGRVIIIITMFAGRVGPLTLAVALGEAKGTQNRYRYPKEELMIG